MGIQFSITVDDDRIEVARGACVFAIDRTTAMPHDYVTIGEACGDSRVAGFIRSLAPTPEQVMQTSIAAMVAGAGPELLDDLNAMAQALAETPLEACIRERVKKDGGDDAVDQKARMRVERERLASQAKAQREQQGETQYDAAKAVGVVQGYISRMERLDPLMSDKAAITLAKRVISHYSAMANEKPLPTRFGEVLRAARKAKCLTSDQLGEEVGLARNYILKIERDPYRAAPRATVEKIAAFLGVLNVERFWKEAA